MSTVNLSAGKTNNQIMADSLLNVQNIQLNDTSFGARSASLIPELLIGVPITGAVVTYPYWKDYAKHPINTLSNIKKPNINFNIKPKINSATDWLKNKTRYNALKTNITNSPKGALFIKHAKLGLKGSGVFAVIGTALEVPNLISAYKADQAEKASGNTASNHLGRQAIKSTTKVGAGLLGYAMGSAAAGAVAGSVFPVIGNIGGAIVGFVGGCIGGMLAGYAADKIVGEHTESEEYMAKVDSENKEKALTLAKEAESNPETQAQLLSAMYEKIQKGEITDKEVIAAFEKEAAQYQSGNKSSLQMSTDTGQNSDNSSLINQLNGIKNCCNNLYYNA